MPGLTVEQLDRFRADGFLIVEGVLAPEDLAGVEDEYRDILDRVAADLVGEGRIRPLRGATFSERYMEAMQQIDDMYTIYQHLDICLPMVKELDLSHTMNAGPEVFHLLTHPSLLDIVESVIGLEIYSNPVQHTRIKPPARYLSGTVTDSNIAATTWHQDAGVVNAEAIIDRDRIVPLEVEAGGVVLLHKLIEHGSLDNQSDDIRWSFDLRYQPIGQPTGRAVFPGFVAHSMAMPDRGVTDHHEWGDLWWRNRDRIVSGDVPWQFNARWDANALHPVCA